MHSPGVCGILLADGTEAAPEAAHFAALINALNASTDIVLVATGENAQSIAPVIWASAAYEVVIPASAGDAEALRLCLQEVLSRGRDTALVITPRVARFTEDTAGQIIAAYVEAADEIWAVLPGTSSEGAGAVLLGRNMIERLVRGPQPGTLQEALASNREHCLVIASPGAALAGQDTSKS